MRRVEAYLQRPFSVPGTLVESPIPGAGASPARRGRWAAAAALLLAAGLAWCARELPPAPDGPVVRAAEPAPVVPTLDAGLLDALRLATDARSVALALGAGGDGERSPVPSAAWVRMQDTLRTLLVQCDQDSSRTVILRAGLRIGMRGFMPLAADHLAGQDAVLDAERELLFELARAGGPESVSHVQKAAVPGVVSTSDFIEALILTRQRRAVAVADAWLLKHGARAEDRFAALARFSFPEAAERLVLAFQAGADGPALRRALLERADAIERLRAGFLQEPADRRARILGLLGQARCAEAVPELERLLLRGIDQRGVEQTLLVLAQNGDREALFALVRSLPAAESLADLEPRRSLVEDLADWPLDAQARALAHLRSADASASRALKRRILLASCLIGGELGVDPALSALAEPREQRGAMLALKLAGPSPRAVSAAVARLDATDRAVRRLALEIVAGHGGEAAGRHLSRALQRTEDRRIAVGLAAGAPRDSSWASAVLTEAQRYRDVSETARTALKTRSQAPPDGRRAR